mmetsp:Transcript_44423/g.117894  ORF Transcript_44423/g.117894 Transcript_44423/m.117894 type:complete len:337 (-) Transcript_44423:141-1151(-)
MFQSATERIERRLQELDARILELDNRVQVRFLEAEQRTESLAGLLTQIEEASATMRTETNGIEIDTPSVMHFDIHEIADCDDKQEEGAIALDELAMVYERLELSGRFPIDQLHLTNMHLRPCDECFTEKEEDAVSVFTLDSHYEECLVHTPPNTSVSDRFFDQPLADLEDVLRLCTTEIDLTSFDDPLSDLEDVLRVCAASAETVGSTEGLSDETSPLAKHEQCTIVQRAGHACITEFSIAKTDVESQSVGVGQGRCQHETELCQQVSTCDRCQHKEAAMPDVRCVGLTPLCGFGVLPASMWMATNFSYLGGVWSEMQRPNNLDRGNPALRGLRGA